MGDRSARGQRLDAGGDCSTQRGSDRRIGRRQIPGKRRPLGASRGGLAGRGRGAANRSVSVVTHGPPAATAGSRAPCRWPSRCSTVRPMSQAPGWPRGCAGGVRARPRRCGPARGREALLLGRQEKPIQGANLRRARRNLRCFLSQALCFPSDWPVVRVLVGALAGLIAACGGEVFCLFMRRAEQARVRVALQATAARASHG